MQEVAGKEEKQMWAEAEKRSGTAKGAREQKSNSQNEMRLEFDSRSCNEGFARVTVAAFLTQLNPTVEEVADVKTAVSEAVTNAIIHGYEGNVEKIEIYCRICGKEFQVEVIDRGRGIANVPLAMEPLFTTKAECDRAGMGFAFMEAFMDSLEVESEVGKGTCVRMTKRIVRERADTQKPEKMIQNAVSQKTAGEQKEQVSQNLVGEQREQVSQKTETEQVLQNLEER